MAHNLWEKVPKTQDMVSKRRRTRQQQGGEADSEADPEDAVKELAMDVLAAAMADEALPYGVRMGELKAVPRA